MKKPPYLTSTISIRLSPAERRAIEDRANAESRTASNLLRKCVREMLLAHTPRVHGHD